MFANYAETKIGALEARVAALEKENLELREKYVVAAYKTKFEEVAGRSITDNELKAARELTTIDLQSATDNLEQNPPPPIEIYPIGV